MNPVAERILAEALQTSPEDRPRMARRLIASLETDTGPNVETAWQQEVQQRIRATK